MRHKSRVFGLQDQSVCQLFFSSIVGCPIQGLQFTAMGASNAILGPSHPNPNPPPPMSTAQEMY